MSRKLLFVCVCLATAPAHAQSSNSFIVAATPVHLPTVKNFNRFDYAMYGAIVAYRVGDYLTTERALAGGGREGELPAVLVANKPAFAAYSAGMAALEIESSVYLHRHGHKKLARFVNAASVGIGAETDIRNSLVRLR